ncbi:MAG: RNA-binding protein [Chrysiogenales bacterium]|nr:MAG: RNA-binding protein [Chrysiogenales bacterium]
MSVNIYVGNLSYDATESQLKDLFGQYGEVLSVKIIMDQYSGRSKGFGFIEMADKNDAESAIQKLDGTSMLDRNIKVNIAKPKTETRRSNRY